MSQILCCVPRIQQSIKQTEALSLKTIDNCHKTERAKQKHEKARCVEDGKLRGHCRVLRQEEATLNGSKMV